MTRDMIEEETGEDETNQPAQMPKWYSAITVEPTMFLYMMAFMLTTVIEQVFFVYKACRVDHGYPEEVCRNIQEYDNVKKEVQKTVAIFHQWEQIASHAIPIVLALFLGAWSDKRGRKLPLIIGLIGKFYYSCMIIVIANQPTWTLNYVIYVAIIPMAFTGADVAIFASCFAYISDVTTVASRTLRITILDATYLSTMPTGIALGSRLYKLFNQSFGWMFACNATLLFISIVYSLLRLKWQTTSKQRPISDIGYHNLFRDFFDKNHVIRSFKTLTKPRPDGRRAYIWILLFAMACYTFQRDERPMLYLYTQLKLNWDTHIYSWFRTYQSSAYVIMMLVGIPVMTKLLKWKDTILIMIGATAHATGRIFFILATSTAFMYLGATVASLGPIVAPVIRSIASKLVGANERGVIFSILSVFDNAVSFISATLYSQLYTLTIDFYPAAIFWLTIVTQVIVFGLITIMHIRLKGGSISPPKEEVESSKDSSLIPTTSNGKERDIEVSESSQDSNSVDERQNKV